MQWGGGSAVPDIQISRLGAGQLAVTTLGSNSSTQAFQVTPVFDVDNVNNRVGIGTTTPAVTLQVIGDIRVGNGNTNGCLQNFSGGTIAGTACVSDIRLKKDITPLTGILDKLTMLQPSWYYWNATAQSTYRFGTDKQLGLIAQDVQKVFPALVSQNDQGYKEVNYSAIPLYMLEALKELSAVAVKVKDGIVHVGQLIADRITAKTVVTDSIQMKDTATGTVYCVHVTNGEFVKTKGACN
jgi:ethanolamine utilization microcompartment shell protein EutS